jgi:protoporphyrinogen oxidase
MERAPIAPVIILGAGPAGLTAAYELSKKRVPSILLEQDGVVGGLARTVEYKGYRFDIGGHRFYTKLPLIEKIWKDILGDDLLVRPRLSRIYFHSKFFHYPLEPWNAFAGLGPVEALRCLASFVRSHVSPSLPEDDLETWVSNRFGRRLFETFFKTYTEKVWGLPCREIRSDWGRQRIRDLSLFTLVWHSIAGNKKKGATPKTLARRFFYPRRGPGMMWSGMREIVERQGARVVFHAPVEEILWERGRVTAVRAGGTVYPGDHFISSIPIAELIALLKPEPPPELQQALGCFHYRGFITVAVIVRGKDLFPDNWIYIHDPAVAVGRIQNFNNWSPEMAPDSSTTCLGLEYFCQPGDALWALSDEQLAAQAKRELTHLGLIGGSAILDAKVVRVPKAYPVYDNFYQNGLRLVRQFLETTPNLQLVGRNGMHRYNNQDHSMLTGILAARNAMGASYNLWDLVIDSGYLEEDGGLNLAQLEALDDSQPRLPSLVASA